MKKLIEELKSWEMLHKLKNTEREDLRTIIRKMEEQLTLSVSGCSVMYKATFSFFKNDSRGGVGYWTEEVIILQAAGEIELNEKITVYLNNDYCNYHKHITLKDIKLL